MTIYNLLKQRKLIMKFRKDAKMIGIPIKNIDLLMKEEIDINHHDLIADLFLYGETENEIDWKLLNKEINDIVLRQRVVETGKFIAILVSVMAAMGVIYWILH